MAGYKRRIFLINPKFQLRLSGLICFIVLISSMFYPITLFDITEKFISFITTNNPSRLQEMIEYKQALIVFLALFQVGFVAMSFIVCIYISHKIAGPIYKLEQYLTGIREHGRSDRLFFRKGDYFVEIADEVNNTLDHIEELHKSDMVYLSEVSTYIKNLESSIPDDKKPVINEIISKLGEMEERFQSS